MVAEESSPNIATMQFLIKKSNKRRWRRLGVSLVHRSVKF